MQKGQKYGTVLRAGFTLVEVIVVLTILAVISSALVPAFTTFIDRANQNKCAVALTAIQNQYAIEAELVTDVSKKRLSDPSAAFRRAATEYGGSNVNGLTFTGPCGTGGCTATVSDDGMHVLSIICPVHSADQKTPFDKGKAAIEAMFGSTMSVTGRDKITREVGVFDQYFTEDRLDKGYSLDSEGLNFAPEINKDLKALGFDMDEASWRVWAKKVDGVVSFQVYFTKGNIKDMDVGSKVPFVKCEYSYEYGKTEPKLVAVSSGTCPVAAKTVTDKDSKDVQIHSLDPSSKSTAYDTELGASWKDTP